MRTSTRSTVRRTATTPGRRPREAPPAATPALVNDTFFRHLVDGMRNGVLAITRDGRLAIINAEAYRIFGLTARPDDLGQPMATVLRERPDIVRALAGVFDLHHLPNRAEMRLKPSGKVIGYTLALVRDDRGTPVGAAMFFKDLTRVEQLEERERLRDRLAAVGQMAAAIAHEVKNPLAGIGVMAGLLRRRLTESPEAQQVLSDIITEARMANAIVQEVLDFVRPIQLQIEPLALADAVEAALPLSDTKDTRGEARAIVDLPPDLPRIQGDPYQLAQLFTNLFLNAWEAMGGRGRVTVSGAPVLLEDGGDGREAVHIEVADDGPGMAPEVLDKVFDPFFTTKPQGSGLGLAIVRKIVDAHDGRLDVRSAPGLGTTIRVTLPVRAATDDEHPAEDPGASAPGHDAIRGAAGSREEHGRHGADTHR
jgi:signal transduction histidine kinase